MSFEQPPWSDPTIRLLTPWIGGLVNAVLRAHMEAPFREITSWYRNPPHNTAVGGAATSQHLVGLAVDLIPASEVGADALRRQGLFVVNEFDHLHVQAWPAGFLADLVDAGLRIPR